MIQADKQTVVIKRSRWSRKQYNNNTYYGDKDQSVRELGNSLCTKHNNMCCLGFYAKQVLRVPYTKMGGSCNIGTLADIGIVERRQIPSWEGEAIKLNDRGYTVAHLTDAEQEQAIADLGKAHGVEFIFED